MTTTRSFRSTPATSSRSTSRPNGRDVLARLLRPHAVEDFFAEVWEAEHLHIGRAENPDLAAYFDELLPLDRLDELITTTYAREPRHWSSVRLGREGTMIPTSEYQTRRDGDLALIDVDRVLELHRGGASIILNAVHTVFEPIGELCRAISEVIGAGVHANVYVTPPRAQGFPLHFDPHDVFLLQVAGQKDWKLSPTPVPLATWEPQGPGDLVPQGPETPLSLAEGELLYIPRGLLHEGVASEALSVHITIGMNPHSWALLFHELVKELEAGDVDFRRSFPVWEGSGDGFQAALSELAGRLGDVERARGVAERMAEAARARTPASHRGLFKQIHDPPPVSLETRVRVRDDCAPEVRANGGDVTLSFGRTVLTLPAFTAPALEALCSGDAACGADLPPTLDEEGKLVLLRRLVREGLLVAGE